MNQQENEQKRKPGRPRKMRNLIIYRCGRKLKAYNIDLCVDMVPNEREITTATTIYSGLGEDHVAWGRKLTRDGGYNIAQRNPFRKVTSYPSALQKEMLEKYYRNYPQLRKVMDTCAELFNGHIPEETIILEGSRWMRILGNIFYRDAGAEGISRTHYKRPEGKIYAAVNVLETQGQGINYSLEIWQAVCQMFYPPVFCIRMTGEETPADYVPDGWAPKELANAILHSLWQQKGIDSCAADAPSPEATPPLPPVASEDPEPSHPPSDPVPPPTGDPDAVCDEGVISRTVVSYARVMALSTAMDEVVFGAPAPEPTVMTEADVALPAQVIPEARATDNTRTWGEIKQTMISLKGLSTSKDLQAPATLSRILDTVISHEATARLTAECRAIADKKSRNEYKSDNLHVFYPSCVFAGRAGGSKKENVIGYTGIACLDFDGMKTQEDAENMRDDLFMEFPEILFCAVSASGLGVYALVMLEFDGTEAGYKDALSAAMEQFEAKGYIPDAGCSDATRARYMSSDADALSRPDAYVPKAFAGGTEGAFILPATMLRSCWTNSGRKKKGAGKLYLEEALSRIETAPEGSKDTTLTSVMGSVARLIRNYSMDSNKVYDQVRKVAAACDFDTRKTEDKIRRLGVKNEGVGL